MSKKSKKQADTKNKKKAKDLKVNKETVQGLSDDELGDVHGGVIMPKSQICPKVPIQTLFKCPGTIECGGGPLLGR